MKSIRRYLVIILLASICLLNFLAALHGYRNSFEQAQELLDKQLLESAQLLSHIKTTDQNIPLQNSSGDTLFQIWYGDNLILKSNNAPDTALHIPDLGYHDINYDGRRWRTLIYAENSMPNYTENHWFIIAKRADLYSRIIDDIVLESILPIIWVLPFIGFIIWGIVSIGLRPLKRLAYLLRNRHSEDLTPLQDLGYPNELADVVLSTNSLLARLDFAFEREKRFAADAAHELRTPLATLKINLHNLACDIDSQNPNYQQLIISANRMAHSVEQILALYRLNAENVQDSAERIDVQALTQQVIIDCYQEVENKHQHLELQSTPIYLHANRFALQTLLRNIIDNASKYTPQKGKILIAINNLKSTVTVTVEDSGPGIPNDKIDRVFDRFYRLGGDNHNSGVTGCGLGLSIVERIVKLHRGNITLCQSKDLGGLKVFVSLPISQDFQ